MATTSKIRDHLTIKAPEVLIQIHAEETIITMEFTQNVVLLLIPIMTTNNITIIIAISP